MCRVAHDDARPAADHVGVEHQYRWAWLILPVVIVFLLGVWAGSEIRSPHVRRVITITVDETTPPLVESGIRLMLVCGGEAELKRAFKNVPDADKAGTWTFRSQGRDCHVLYHHPPDAPPWWGKPELTRPQKIFTNYV
jgi:hypothetical protein